MCPDKLFTLNRVPGVSAMFSLRGRHVGTGRTKTMPCISSAEAVSKGDTSEHAARTHQSAWVIAEIDVVFCDCCELVSQIS